MEKDLKETRVIREQIIMQTFSGWVIDNLKGSQERAIVMTKIVAGAYKNYDFCKILKKWKL